MGRCAGARGLRLMLGRRAIGLAGSLLIAGVAFLGDPMDVRAADIAGVDFPAPGGGDWEIIGTASFTAPTCAPASGGMHPNAWAGWPDVAGGTSDTAYGDATGEGGCRSENVVGTSSTADDFDIAWRFPTIPQGNYKVTIAYQTDNNSRCVGADWVSDDYVPGAPLGSGGVLGPVSTDQCANHDAAPGFHFFEGSAPAGAIGIRYRAASWVYLHVIQVEGQNPEFGGTCEGVGEMVGPTVLSSESGLGSWGINWLEIEGRGYCNPKAGSGVGVVTWVDSGILPTMAEGEIYCLESEWYSNVAGAYVTIYATDASGGSTWQFAGYPMRNNPNGIGGVDGQDRTACVTAPADAWGLRWAMQAGIYNGGQLLRDGTTEDLAAYPPTGKSPTRVDKNVTDTIDEECGEEPEAPDGVEPWEWTAFVASWVARLACIARVGFVAVVDWLIEVVDGLIAMAGDLASFVGSIPGGAIDGLAGILSDLFMPTEDTADAWQDLLDLLGSKVPTAWIGEAVGFVTSMVTAGNLAGGPIANLGTPWGPVSIAAPSAAVTESFEDYRPVGSALLTLGCAVAILRQIRGALGSSA